MAKEHELPTIRDLRDQLSDMVDQGLGGLSVQVVVVPDTTIQTIAALLGRPGKPAVMIEFLPTNNRSLGVAFITAERLSPGGGMPSVAVQ